MQVWPKLEQSILFRISKKGEIVGIDMICCQQCCLSNWFSKFNGEGGTVQYHLTIKYIQHLIQFYTFWRSVWVLFNNITTFF